MWRSDRPPNAPRARAAARAVRPAGERHARPLALLARAAGRTRSRPAAARRRARAGTTAAPPSRSRRVTAGRTCCDLAGEVLRRALEQPRPAQPAREAGAARTAAACPGGWRRRSGARAAPPARASAAPASPRRWTPAAPAAAARARAAPARRPSRRGSGAPAGAVIRRCSGSARRRGVERAADPCMTTTSSPGDAGKRSSSRVARVLELRRRRAPTSARVAVLVAATNVSDGSPARPRAP